MIQKRIRKLLCQLVLERTDDPTVFDEEKCRELLRREATDWLFILLGVFTYAYIALLAFVFFGHQTELHPFLAKVLETLLDPYLTALGIYVVLKEIRKGQRSYPSRYWGELFVVVWLVCTLGATVAILIDPSYQFDTIYKTIVSGGLVALLIYIGGFIHKP